MKTTRRIFIFALLVSMLALIVSVPVQAGQSCHRIIAIGIGQDLGGGNTEARIIGGGILNGTTAASFTVTGLSGTTASFTGPITFTTRRGTLEVTVLGTLDVETGVFNASGPVTDSTGRLEGAAGSLAFEGIQNLTTGKFIETVKGRICV